MATKPAGEEAAPMDEGADAGAMDAGGGAEGAEMPEDEEGSGHDVLLTVCKEADGTYRLIQGDEEDADAGGAAEDDATGMEDEGPGKTYDSKGALLKAILDVLNEDESAGGGSDEDSFQAGFGGAPAAGDQPPTTAMPQKY